MNKDGCGKIVSAKATIIFTQPFFATLLLRMDMIEDPSIPTMCTDGRVIRYNPDFVIKQTAGKLVGLLCHECLHPALGHPYRRGNRDPRKFNRSTDYPVNQIVLDAGMELPEGGLVDKKYGYMTAEAIYAQLPDEPENGKDDWNIGGVEDAVGEDGEKASESEMIQQQEEWKVALSQATEAAKAQGKLPAGLERLIEDILEPKLDWRALLRRFVEQIISFNYSWSRPNKRYIHQKLYLPSIIKDDTVNVAVGVDTSGSISQEELEEFSGEITGILSEFRSSCDVVYCDTQVNHVDHFDYEDFPIKMNAKGGGGTDLTQIEKWVSQQQELPKCLIIFTDLYTNFSEQEPEFPVLWISKTKTITPPYGELIILE
jgi:predicted metal-dependent peptidase